jgi:hypothetical protein
MLRLKRAATLAAVLFAAACTADSMSPTAPTGPLETISDAAHSGAVPGFYFLPSMVPQPSYSGTFDAALQPRVEICELSGSACVTTIATFTFGTGPGNVKLDAAGEQYHVNWKTSDFNLDPAKSYRISVYQGTFQLGYADVDVVGSAKDLKNVDTGQFIPLLDDRTLPIKFRIETGIAAQVVVTPALDSINVGETTQFTATCTDLHNNVVACPATTWTSSNPAVATVDNTGLATGVDAGTVTITASIGYVQGTATLVVIEPNTPPVANDDSFEAIGNFTVPVDAPGVLANDTDVQTPGGLSVVPGTVATTGGGTAMLAADGSFTYLSAAGFTGSDSFSYTVTDGSLTATATVTMTSTTRVWYVDNSAAAPGDGRDASPFSTLAAAEGPSTPGETIFLLYGNGSSVGYNAGFTFQAGQSLTGQGVPADVTVMLNGQSVVLLDAGNAPTVTNTAAGATLRLAANNTAQGMNVLSTAGAGISGSGFGTFAVSAMNVAAIGGPSVDLQNGTVAASFTSLSSSNSPSDGLRLTGVGGTLSASAGVIVGAADAGVEVTNAAGVLDVDLAGMQVQGSGGDGVHVDALASASVAVAVTGGNLAANRGDHFQAAAAGNATLDVTFTGNVLSGGHPSPLGQGIVIGATAPLPGFAGTVTYTVANNTINGAVTSAVITNLGPSTAGASFSGTVSGNQIGTAGVALSCSAQGSGISVEAHGNGTHTASVTGNTIKGCLDRGISVLANGGAGTANLTVTGNSVDELVNPSSREGFFLNAGSTSTDSHFVCLVLGGAGASANSLTQGPSATAAIRARQRFGTTVRLPGYVGGNTDIAAVTAFLSAQNGGASAVADAAVPPGGGFVGGAACPLP